jgi:putative membrane protein
MIYLLFRWAVLTAALILTAWILPGIGLTDDLGTAIFVALIFGVVNAVLGTILQIISLPITILTLGLFALVINAAMLELTAAITDNLTIDNFWWALLGALLISFFSAVMNSFLRTRQLR